MNDRTVGIDPVSGQFLAEADALGPAVRHDLTSYQIRAVTVAAPDLPIGYDLGQDVFQVSPKFRSGTVLRVGTDATVMIDGRLLDSAGQPISLVAGDAEPVEAPDAKVLAFFTNRKGRFRIDGAIPGTYNLRLRRWPEITIRIELPEDAAGLYQIGKITMPISRKN